MTLEQAMNILHGAQWKGSVLGLQRMEEMTELLGHPERKLRFVHVAGTNGKGSTSKIIASVLQEAGYTVGLYTSPHLVRYNERYQVNGEEITDEEFIELAEDMEPALEKMEDKATEFEVLTGAAFVYFLKKNCDIVVLETGLGGRLDATNVIPTPEVAVITHIGLEHTEILGDTYEKIAGEKAGIIKEGGKVVYYPSIGEDCEAEIEEVYRKKCEETGSELIRSHFDDIKLVSEDLKGSAFNWHGYEDIELPLIGAHQVYNCVVALTALDVLGRKKHYNISTRARREGLRKALWPARMEVLGDKPLFILDGGHNPQCIDTVVNSLKSLIGDKKVSFVLGLLRDKDYPQMTDRLMEVSDTFMCLTPDSDRAMNAADLTAYLNQKGAKAAAFDEPADAIKAAIESVPEDGIVVSLGSLYLAGAVRESYRNNVAGCAGKTE